MLKPTDSPFWQAARPSPRPMCVLPVPELPTAMMFSRRVTYSGRAGSFEVLLSDGMAKSKLSRLCGGELRLLDPTLHHAFALDQLSSAKRSEADMIEALGGALPSSLSYSRRNVGSEAPSGDARAAAGAYRSCCRRRPSWPMSSPWACGRCS